MYWEIKKEMGRELCMSISCYQPNERNGTVWLRNGILELRGLKKGAERGRCP
jgi:hypothetical protein